MVDRSLLYSQMEDDMILLYHNLDMMLPASVQKVLQFISSRRGEGTSAVVKAFAMVAAKNACGRVLLLETNHIDPCIEQQLLEDRPNSVWKEVCRTPSGSIYREAESNLHVCPVSSITSIYPRAVNMSVMEKFWAGLKEGFDLIIVDSPPVDSSPEGVIMARHADATVLVLEAEKTRREIAEAAKEKLRKAGGNLLGVVFNKQRYPIPEFIYKKL